MSKKTFYSKYKIFHYKDKVDSLIKSSEDIKSPLHIRIKPTNICNHDCWYCAYKSSDLQLGQDMVERDFIPKDKMFEIINDCQTMGVKAITFSGGGEPFVYKYFLETLQQLIKTNIKFASLTNGSKLSGEIAEIFAHHGTWIRISMDGWDDESYHQYRKTGKKEFSKILKNIENFKKLNGKCTLGVSYIVDEKNHNHIFEFAQKIKDAGADSLKISPCIVSNEGIENDLYHRPFFKEAKRLSIEVKEKLEDDTFEVYESYHKSETDFSKSYDWCPYLQILTVIGADLNIYSCQDKAYNLDNGLLGSIKEKSLKEFWFNDKSKFFKINPCKDCNHHCVSNEKNKMILDYLNSNHLEFV